jgi:hypothetical protein
MGLRNSEFTEKLALFYYFLFLDENRAQSATVRTLKKINKSQVTSLGDAKEFSPQELVRQSNDFVSKHGSEIRPTNLSFSAGYIVLPEKSNWGPWFEFRKVENPVNFAAVLYAKILKLPEAEIAEGLGVSIGTLHYRLGRGLKTLGRICQLGGFDAE